MITLLPLYVHPLESARAWEAVALAGPSVTAVINIHNGPGLDAAYDEAIGLLHSAGVPMLGYIDLNYGRRPVSLVHADIEAWQRYPLSGAFLDQAPTDPALLGQIGMVLRRVNGMTVLNPGTRPHPDYSALPDLICTFEGQWSAYARMPHVADFGNAAHLVYGVPGGELDSALALLSARCGAGLVTDLQAPLPYCGIPSWFTARVPQ